MARTRRVAQPGPPSQDPVEPPVVKVEDEKDETLSWPPSDPPLPKRQVARKRRRESNEASPTPASKKSKAKAKKKEVIVVDSEIEVSDDDESSTLLSAGDDSADTDSELATPKASQINPVKPGGLLAELDREMNGDLSSSQSVPDPRDAEILIIPLASYTLHNHQDWATSFYESDRIHKVIKAMPDTDAWLDMKGLKDSYLETRGHYKNLPCLPGFKLHSRNEEALMQEGANGTATVYGMTVLTWVNAFKPNITAEYIVRLLRLPRQGHFINPSTENPSKLMFKEENSRNGPGSAFVLCERANGSPVVSVSVGAMVQNFLKEGTNVGIDGRPPFARCITMVMHKMEYERKTSLEAVLWGSDDIHAPIDRRFLTLQTFCRSNSNADSLRNEGSRIGKLNLAAYSSPGKLNPPPSRPGPSSALSSGRGPSYIGFNQEVPIYDGRGMALDPDNLGTSLATLPMWPASEELNSGAGIVAGYMTQASRYQSIWKITYYIQWFVVVAH